MVFKYITVAIFAMVLFNSCQQINPLPPTPVKVKSGQTTVVVADTIFAPVSCGISGYLYVNGSQYFYVSSSTVFASSSIEYNVYSYANLSNDYIQIYIKRQNLNKKKFKIIPYNSNYKFNNYHEAMVKINLNYPGLFYSESGTLNMSTLYDVYMCDAKFKNMSGGSDMTASFTY